MDLSMAGMRHALGDRAHRGGIFPGAREHLVHSEAGAGVIGQTVASLHKPLPHLEKRRLIAGIGKDSPISQDIEGVCHEQLLGPSSPTCAQDQFAQLHVAHGKAVSTRGGAEVVGNQEAELIARFEPMGLLPEQGRRARASHQIKQVAIHRRRDDPERRPVLA